MEMVLSAQMLNCVWHTSFHLFVAHTCFEQLWLVQVTIVEQYPQDTEIAGCLVEERSSSPLLSNPW